MTLPIKLTPNTVTHNVVLATLANAGHWAQALQVLVAMREGKSGKLCEPSLVSFNSTLLALERSGKWEHVLSLLAELPSPDKRSLHTGLSVCAKHGDWQRALALLHSMQGQDVAPDLHCHTALINSFQKSLSWQRGLQYVMRLDREKLDVVGYNAALGLCKAGCWQDALWLLQESRLRGGPDVLGLCLAADALTASGSSCALPHLYTLYDEILESAQLLLKEMQADASEAATKLRASRGVQLVLAMDTLHAAGRMSPALEDAFRDVIWRPAMEDLQLLAASADLSSSRLATLHGLGAYFTGEALSQMGIASENCEEWILTAKEAVASALDRCFSGALPPPPPSARELFSWVSYLVFQPGSEESAPIRFRNNGLTVAHGLHQWPEGSDFLKPIFLTFDRSQHSERRALLKVVQRLLEQGASSDATGTVRLFSCHTPCMSCLYVFAQFQALFPKIRLAVAFSPWSETREFCRQWQQLGVRSVFLSCLTLSFVSSSDRKIRAFVEAS